MTLNSVIKTTASWILFFTYMALLNCSILPYYLKYNTNTNESFECLNSKQAFQNFSSAVCYFRKQSKKESQSAESRIQCLELSFSWFFLILFEKNIHAYSLSTTQPNPHTTKQIFTSEDSVIECHPPLLIFHTTAMLGYSWKWKYFVNHSTQAKLLNSHNDLQ